MSKMIELHDIDVPGFLSVLDSCEGNGDAAGNIVADDDGNPVSLISSGTYDKVDANGTKIGTVTVDEEGKFQLKADEYALLSVYDIRDLLNATIQLRDGKPLTEMNLGFKEKMVVKKLLEKIRGTDIEKLLKEYHVIE